MKVFFKSANKVICLGILVFSGVVQAQDLKPFKPFEISFDKTATSLQSSQAIHSGLSGTHSNSSVFFQDVLQQSSVGFDFLTKHDKGYLLSTNKQGIFGDELVVGMKFADWLTLRLNVIDEDTSYDMFSLTAPGARSTQSGTDYMGYQFGVSSVLNISQNWRLGIDLGKGRVGGDLLGLYQDQVETTSLGFGIRSQKFGATLQSDFLNSASSSEVEQSTLDFQLDWHFTKDGTVSFGARRNVMENSSSSTSLDQLTGTVPYIKFKHNL